MLEPASTETEESGEGGRRMWIKEEDGEAGKEEMRGEERLV